MGGGVLCWEDDSPVLKRWLYDHDKHGTSMVSQWYCWCLRYNNLTFALVKFGSLSHNLRVLYISKRVFTGISSNMISFDEVQLALAAALRFHDSKFRFPWRLSEEDAKELVKISAIELFGDLGVVFPFSYRETSQNN